MGFCSYDSNLPASQPAQLLCIFPNQLISLKFRASGNNKILIKKPHGCLN